MTDWQLLYAGLLTLATLTGRPHKALLLVMWGNFCLTLLVNGDPRAVAIADIICASVLVMRTPREAIIAALFLIMIPVYILSHHLSWPAGATYAIVDIIAYAQLCVMGKVDGGYSGIRHYFIQRGHSRRDRLATSWANPRHQEPSRKESSR
jgi:hypothetical protein